jgi:DNA-directed RNA polymerase subunit RPC12/RpoP
MPSYKCSHCPRTFSSPYGLKRHISIKHQYVDEDIRDEKEFKPTIQTDEPGLWDDEKPTEENLFSDDDFIMNYSEVVNHVRN